MPFTDVIDDYSNGATGTLTDINGDPVGYTISGTSPNTDWNGLDGGARVNANGTQAFTVTFDQPIVGASVQMSGSDSNELYFVEIDGVTVNLQTLIDDGDVTLTQSGAATHQIGADGSIAGGHHSDGSVAELVFHIPVTTLGVYGTNGHSGNWDFFEVGIDSTSFDVVCFGRGTAIATPSGDRLIEDMRPGDMVQTAENGAQPVTWIGTRRFNRDQLTAFPRLRPVCINAGALGQGLPKRDLHVSRQHRMVVSSKIAQRMFGAPDVMVPAIRLIELPGIFIDEACDSIEYFHVLLAHHEVLLAEGAPSESLYCGKRALNGMTKDAMDEILEIFPELANPDFAPKSSVPLPDAPQQKKLIERHRKNGKPVLSAQL